MSKKWFFLITGVSLVIAWGLISQILTTLKSGDKLTVALDKLHQLEVQNTELKRRLEEVKSPEFAEKEARDKLGLIKEGETLVIIPKDKIDQVLGIAKKVEEVKLPNWQGWLKLFLR